MTGFKFFPMLTRTKPSILLSPCYIMRRKQTLLCALNRNRNTRGRERQMAGISGGIHDVPSSQNSLEIDSLARFAVEDYNKKQNALLEFGKVVSAKEQVVAGTMYYITLEATDGGKKKIYETEIWEKPWLNFKEVQEFKPVDDAPVESSS